LIFATEPNYLLHGIFMKNNSFFILFVCLIACVPQFCADIYTPSVITISQEMGIDISLSQFSISIYLIGLTITLIPFGIAADAYGRKAPMLIGTSLLLIGSIICIISNNIYLLLAGRFIQGMGAGSISAIWRTIFRDRFKGEEMAKYASYVLIFVTFIMPAAPAVGGFLQTRFNWQANFWFLSAYSLLVLLLIGKYYQNPKNIEFSGKVKFSDILDSLKIIFTNMTFLKFTSVNFVTYGALFASLVISPVLLIHGLNLSPEKFGLIMFGLSATGMALAGIINSRMLAKFSSIAMMKFGLVMMLLSGILMLIFYYLFGFSLFVIVIPLWLFLFGSSFIWPNSFSNCFEAVPAGGGIVGAVYTLMQQSGGSIVGSCASFLKDVNQISLSCIFISAALYSLLILKGTSTEKDN